MVLRLDAKACAGVAKRLDDATGWTDSQRIHRTWRRMSNEHLWRVLSMLWVNAEGLRDARGIDPAIPVMDWLFAQPALRGAAAELARQGFLRQADRFPALVEEHVRAVQQAESDEEWHAETRWGNG